MLWKRKVHMSDLQSQYSPSVLLGVWSKFKVLLLFSELKVLTDCNILGLFD